jgi:hypothetical protein
MSLSYNNYEVSRFFEYWERGFRMLYCCLSVAVEKDFQILQCEALVIVVVLMCKGFPKHNVKLQ